MRGYYEVQQDGTLPSHTDEGHEITSHALNGFGHPIVTLTNDESTEDLEAVTLTVDSKSIEFTRTEGTDFFTAETVLEEPA